MVANALENCFLDGIFFLVASLELKFLLLNLCSGISFQWSAVISEKPSPKPSVLGDSKMTSTMTIKYFPFSLFGEWSSHSQARHVGRNVLNEKILVSELLSTTFSFWPFQWSVFCFGLNLGFPWRSRDLSFSSFCLPVLFRKNGPISATQSNTPTYH